MDNKNNTQPSKLKQYFWGFVTVAVLLIYWMFKKIDFTSKSTTVEDKTVQDNTAIVDSLKQVIKSNEEKYDVTIESLTDSIVQYQFIISRNNKSIQTQNTKTDEKVNNTVTLTANELYQFLADRYKDSTSTKR